MPVIHRGKMPILGSAPSGEVVVGPKVFQLGLSAPAVALLILAVSKGQGRERIEAVSDRQTLRLSSDEFDDAEQELLTAGLVTEIGGAA